MFDPTIFDNLKVILEGSIYDLDLNGDIVVIDRNDLIDLATYRRVFRMRFKINQHHTMRDYVYTAQIELGMDAIDVIAEKKLTVIGKEPGCQLYIEFDFHINHDEAFGSRIRKFIAEKWDGRPSIQQVLMYDVDESFAFQRGRMNVKLDFKRKFNENNVSDIERIVETTYEILYQLNQYEFKNENG